ncbi:hypothetical protein AHAS_Ahas11G0294900 [Arachis hypogaea]
MVVVVVKDFDSGREIHTVATVRKKLRCLPHVFSRVLELLFSPMLMLPSKRPLIAFALLPRPKRKMKRLEAVEVAVTPATPRRRRVPARVACVRKWVMLCGELEVSEVTEEDHGDDGARVENEGCEYDEKGHEKEGFGWDGEGRI